MQGYSLTEGQMRDLREVVRHYFNLFRAEEARKERTQQQRDLTVVLEETAEASADPLGEQTTYTASVLRRKRDGTLEDTGEDIEVVNRYEHIDLAQYTLAIVRRIDGEWRLISADCSALTDWPL